MQNNVTFTPINRPDCPALYAGPLSGEYVYQAYGVDGVPLVETFHATFADALRQIALRISLDHSVVYAITQGN